MRKLGTAGSSGTCAPGVFGRIDSPEQLTQRQSGSGWHLREALRGGLTRRSACGPSSALIRGRRHVRAEPQWSPDTVSRWIGDWGISLRASPQVRVNSSCSDNRVRSKSISGGTAQTPPMRRWRAGPGRIVLPTAPSAGQVVGVSSCSGGLSCSTTGNSSNASISVSSGARSRNSTRAPHSLRVILLGRDGVLGPGGFREQTHALGDDLVGQVAGHVVHGGDLLEPVAPLGREGASRAWPSRRPRPTRSSTRALPRRWWLSVW